MNNRIIDYKGEAVRRCVNGRSFVLLNDDFSQLSMLDGSAPPLLQDLQTALLEVQEEMAAAAYRTQRAVEYPAIGDQLDDLFKQGAFSAEMAAKIQAVKDKYPKPSSV